MRISLLLILTIIFAGCVAASAQGSSANQSPTRKKNAVVFKIPDNFLPAKMPPDKNGLTMLNPNAPAGMFMAYTPDNQKSADFVLDLRKMYGGFFGDNKDANLEWKETPLAAHDGVTGETGVMFTAPDKDKIIQVVAYTRTIGENQDVVYGYFAMRDTKSKKNSADFIDDQGKGVKDFDKFWKTVGVQKK